MSLTLRRIAGTAAIAMVALAMVAPHAQATVSTQPVVTLTAADHKTPVGSAVYTLTQTHASVWGVIDHPTANTDYTVNVVIVHVGYSSSTYKACTFHAASTAKAGCIGSNVPITLHHNDIPLITVTHGSPAKTDASARI
jgi:hypothetical protein